MDGWIFLMEHQLCADYSMPDLSVVARAALKVLEEEFLGSLYLGFWVTQKWRLPQS